MVDQEKRIPTSIATADEHSITVRGQDLVEDLIGELTFSEFFYFHLTGDKPTDSERRLFDAMLVTLVEHGITPSVIAARLTYMSAPEALQGAVASGVLGAGDKYLGVVENTAIMLNEGVDEVDESDRSIEDVAREITEQRDHIPGMGHPIHKPEDPRTERLFELMESEGIDGQSLALLRAVNEDVQADKDGPVPLNAAGAIGAIIAEMDLPPITGRGIALIARTAGLIGHLNEEMETSVAHTIWDIVDEEVAYQGNE